MGIPDENVEFTAKAHERAKTELYPAIFGVERSYLSFESTLLHESYKGQICDGELGIDCLVRITAKRLWMRAPLVFSFQERFRPISYLKEQDVTITTWSYDSKQPAELYKIIAEYFLYGYYDPIEDTFRDAINIKMTEVKWGLMNHRYCLNRSQHKSSGNQSFIAIPFRELYKDGVVTYWMQEPKTNKTLAQGVLL